MKDNNLLLVRWLGVIILVTGALLTLGISWNTIDNTACAAMDKATAVDGDLKEHVKESDRKLDLIKRRQYIMLIKLDVKKEDIPE